MLVFLLRIRHYESLDKPKIKENIPVKVEIIPDMPCSRLKALYFQCLFENGNTIHGMTSCPSGKIVEIAGQCGGLILLGHEKEEIYMLS